MQTQKWPSPIEARRATYRAATTASRRAIESLALALVLATISEAAHADAPRCDAVKIDASDALATAWTDAIADLRGQVAQLAGPDCVSARVRIEPAKEGVKLTIDAADGRRAERDVRKPSHLAAIALGVLASIPEDRPSDAAPTPSSAPHAPATPPSRDDLPDFSRAPATAPAITNERAVQLTIGAAAGVRYGAPTRVLLGEVDARIDLVVRKWLVLASIRYAPLSVRTGGAPIGTFGYDELALGLGFGRRVDLGAGTLDVAAIASIVLADEEGIVAGGPKDDAVGDSHAYARLGVTARWLFGAPGGWRFGATIDADGAPSAVNGAKRVDPGLPPIPSWTLGARLGAAGDLL